VASIPDTPPRQPALEGRGSGAKRKHSVDPSEDDLFARSNGGLGLYIFAREAAREEVREGRIDSGVMRVRFWKDGLTLWSMGALDAGVGWRVITAFRQCVHWFLPQKDFSWIWWKEFTKSAVKNILLGVKRDSLSQLFS